MSKRRTVSQFRFVLASWRLGGSNCLGLVAILLLLSFIVSLTVANTNSTFLLLEHPQSLIIFNQYQQRITSEEQARLLRFTPFKILKENGFLGDGFTPCMKVEVNGKEFFIEKDEDGALHGAGRAGFSKTFREVVAVGDTIEIVSNNRLMLSDPAQTQRSRLDEGARVVRVFRNDKLVYVKLLGANERYGWIDLSGSVAGRDWKKAGRLGVSVSEQLQKVLPRIQSKADEVNDKLAKLYNVLNQKSAQSRYAGQAPQWHVQSAKGGGKKRILCTLVPQGSQEKFFESTRALGKSLEGILLGTELKVSSSAGRIEIRPPF